MKQLFIFTCLLFGLHPALSGQITTIEAEDNPIIYAPPPASDVVVAATAPCVLRVLGDTRTNSPSLNLQADFINCLAHLSPQTLALNPFTGNDDTYRLGRSINTNQPITIELRTPSGLDLDLFVMNGNTCITSSITSTGSEFIGPLTWLPSYTLVVDGYNAQQNSAYELLLIYNCGGNPPSSACSLAAQAITCNNSYIGDTRNSSDDLQIASYNCHSGSSAFNGGDDVFRLTNPTANQPVTIQLAASNRDLDLFIIDCAGGINDCIAKSVGSTAYESITINNWRPSYRIVVDAYQPSQNAPYSLTVTCGDPCDDVVPNTNCNAVSYRYSGANGSLRYQFGVSSNLPAGTWYAKRSNGSEVNIGNGRAINHTFNNSGEYTICYRYTDGNGCEQNCCKRIYIEDPYNCNRIEVTKSRTTSVLALSGISNNNAFQWIDDSNGSIVNTNSNQIRINNPAPGDCKPYSVLFFDPATNCYRVCCIEVCEPDCNANILDTSCDALSFSYVGSNGSLSYQFNVSSTLANNGTWTSQGTNGSKISLGGGQTITYKFNATGEYTICYNYVDVEGCPRSCCKVIYIENPYACTLINKTQSGSNYRLSVSGINNSDVIAWVDDSNGGVIRHSTTQITIPIPSPGNCRYISMRYFDTSSRSYRICCIEICEPLCDAEIDNSCNSISYTYTGNNGSLNYQFNMPSNVPNNGVWTAQQSNGTTHSIGGGLSRSYTFITSGEYVICYTYIDSKGCEFRCCKRIFIDNPYACTAITQSRSGNSYLLRLPGINNNDVVRWTDDASGNTLNSSTNQVTVAVPSSGTCQFYSVSYFDLTSNCYRICCIELCGSNRCDPSVDNNCDWISYSYVGNNGSLNYQFSVPTNVPSNGVWSAQKVNGNAITLGSGRSRNYSFTSTGEYILCYSYTDADGCEFKCCKRIYIDNPYNCNLISQSQSGNNYLLSIGGVNSNNIIDWMDDSNNSIINTNSNQVTIAIPAATQCKFYSVRYFDASTNCYRVCCIQVCGPSSPPLETCCSNSANTLDRLKTIYEDMCSDCGVEIYCYTQNGAQGFYVRYGGACPESCNSTTGMVFDCTGTLLGIDRFGNSSVSLDDVLWSCSNSTIPTATDPPIEETEETNEPPFLDRYPWLSNLVDFNDCTGTSIMAYKSAGYVYLYIQTAQGRILYNDAGLKYCTDNSNYACSEVYTNQETIAEWRCGNTLIDTDPCLRNPADCAARTLDGQVPIAPNELQVYPNPAKGKLMIQVPKNKGALESISVLDVRGKVIYQSSLTKNNLGEAIEVNLLDQASGMYLIQIDTNQEVLTKKIVIE